RGAVGRLLLALADLKGPLKGPLPREKLAIVQDRLQDVLLTLRSRYYDLIIQKLEYCEQIDGFNAYKALPEGHQFQAPCQAGGHNLPGERVLIYVELRNVGNVRHETRKDDGAPGEPVYETRLSSQIEIEGEGQHYRRDLKAQAGPLLSRNLCSEC